MSVTSVLNIIDDLIKCVEIDPTLIKSSNTSNALNSSNFRIEKNFGGVKGLHLIYDFISQEDEKLIMDALNDPNGSEVWKYVGVNSSNKSEHRQQIIYGNKLNFSNSQAFETRGKAPKNIEQLGSKLRHFVKDYNTKNPETKIVGDFSAYDDSTKMEIVVNKYGNKDPLGFHFDQAEYFGDCICGLSIQCDSAISFRKNINGRRRTVTLPLPNRSMYMMTEDARYKWKHGILHNKITNGDYRVSLTFREMTVQRN